ncbi:hypothetical protein ACFLR2_01400 [Chlamydiota bacterium]
MAAVVAQDPWALHRASGYLPGQPGYISDLTRTEIFGPSYIPTRAKCNCEWDIFKIAIITGIVIAAIGVTIFLMKHYRIL